MPESLKKKRKPIAALWSSGLAHAFRNAHRRIRRKSPNSHTNFLLHVAYDRAARSLEALSTTFQIKSRGLKDFGGRKDFWMEILEGALKAGHISPFHGAMMTSAFVAHHQDSHGDKDDYLRRAIKLYCADHLEEIFETEGAYETKNKYLKKSIQSAYDHFIWEGGWEATHEEKLREAKMYCLFRDIELGTSQRVLSLQMQSILNKYVPFAMEGIGKRVEFNSSEPNGIRETYSAFPEEDFFPLIESMRKSGGISEQQVALLFCINFHSLETRRNGGHYVDHPMKVARYTMEFADRFEFLRNDPRKRSLALMAALIHDIAEKSGFRQEKLRGLVSPELADLAISLDKPAGMSYITYIETIADNPVAAFVKLCDSYHNSQDKEGKISFKQGYVYPIIANYLLYRLNNPDSKVSVEEFVVRQGICSADEFRQIQDWTDNDRKIEVSEVAAKIPRLNNLIPIENIFDGSAEKVTLDYAHLSGTKDSTIQSQPDIRPGHGC